MLPAVVLVVVVALGVLGRILPSSDPGGGEARSSDLLDPYVGARPATGPRLLVPVADVLWLGTTEIAARGVVDVDISAVEAVVVADGTLLGKATLDVDASGNFDGVVAITPPAERTAARLEVRELGLEGPPLTGVGFMVEAGSALLIVGASSLRARVGESNIVDVLVYESLHEIRTVVTGPGGTLIADATVPVPLRGPRSAARPATLMLQIAVPADVRPTIARLHVLGLDRAGSEVAHVDANLSIAAGE